MRIREACTANPRFCGPESTLAEAAWILWEADCGVLPVVAPDRRIVGIVTDRDLCMGAATKGRPATEIRVVEVMCAPVCTCSSEESLQDALVAMRRWKMRRLPVVDSDGKLMGILSINDLILIAREDRCERPVAVSYGEVMLTLKAICRHRPEPASRLRSPRRVVSQA